MSTLHINADTFPNSTLSTICAYQIRGSNHLILIVEISESRSDSFVIFEERLKFVAEQTRDQGVLEAFPLQKCFQYDLRAALSRLGRLRAIIICVDVGAILIVARHVLMRTCQPLAAWEPLTFFREM